jgi:hypothetical protein
MLSLLLQDTYNYLDGLDPKFNKEWMSEYLLMVLYIHVLPWVDNNSMNNTHIHHNHVRVLGFDVGLIWILSKTPEVIYPAKEYHSIYI